MTNQKLSHFVVSTAIAAAVVYAVMYASEYLKKEQIPSVSSIVRPTQKSEFIDNPTLTGSYLASRIANQNNDLEAAAYYSLKTLESEGGESQYLREDALRLLVAAGRVDEAIVVATEMEQQEQLNTLGSSVLMVDAAQRGDFEAANVRLNQPETEWLDGILFRMLKPLLARWISYGIDVPDKPLVMDSSLKKHQIIEALGYYHLGLINDASGFYDEALKYYQIAVDRPDALPYRLVQVLSNYYLRRGEKEKAIKAFADYSEDHPGSKLVPTTIPNIDDEPASIVPTVTTPQEGIAEVFFTTASILFGQDAMRDTLIFLRLALHLRPDFPPAQLMLANLQEYSNDYAGAIRTYQSINKDTIFYKRGQIRTALDYQILNQSDNAVRLLERLTSIYPDDREPFVVLGDIYRSQKEYHRAIRAYSSAIEMIEGEAQPTDWRLFYARGSCLERAGRWDEAEQDLSKALELNPGEADVLNYMGYSWLVAGTNIEKARDYIEQAHQAEPFEAHIIDSMGWVHYVMGEFEEALEFLEQAVSLVPEDPTINDHLGDVYWRLGREAEARYQWTRALNLEPEDPEAIQKKIDEGMEPFEPFVSTTDEDDKDSDEKEDAADAEAEE